MSDTRITVRKCRVMEGFFSPEKDAVEESLSWKAFLQRFCPPNTWATPHKLLQITSGTYVGLSIGLETKSIVNFVLTNKDRGPQFGWIVDKDPTFAGRVQVVYLVTRVTWASNIKEGPASTEVLHA